MSWQDTLYQSLLQRDVREKAYDSIIEQYRNLAQQAALLKDRNQSLLKATASVREGTSGSGGGESAVARAYTLSLETQITKLKEELAILYRTQGQNAQRLLEMNEALREKDEKYKGEQEEFRLLHVEAARLRERVANHAEVLREKDRNVQIMQDELATLQLEITQLGHKNEKLEQDNKSLLERWIDRATSEADRMNDATAFLLEAEKKGMQLPPAQKSS